MSYSAIPLFCNSIFHILQTPIIGFLHGLEVLHISCTWKFPKGMCILIKKQVYDEF